MTSVPTDAAGAPPPAPTSVDEEYPYVIPSRDDSVVGAAAGLIGGPIGDHAGWRRRWWTPLRVVLAVVTIACCLAFVQKAPCRANAFTKDMYPKLCYTDIAPLYAGRGFDRGATPYVNPVPSERLEYPVLTGLFMQVAAVADRMIVPGNESTVAYQRLQRFFDINAFMLAACAIVGAWFVAATHRRRPYDALLIAPGIVLTAYINWDLLAVALGAGALWAWSRRSPIAAGALIGLGTAAKLYPAFLLFPLLLLCIRARRMREFGQVLGAGVLTWLAVNLPVMLKAFHGWAYFYTFNAHRPESWGSLWLALDDMHRPLPAGTLNAVVALCLVALFAGIAYVAFSAPRRPRLPQLAFLTVAAFLLVNKVYSPQYVLWLVFLFPLARPRWRDFVIWTSLEAAYFVAIWWHLEGIQRPDLAIPNWPHTLATLLRMGGELWVCALIVRDIYRPECDPVRLDGSDDPAGGVLDGAPDGGAHALDRPGQEAVDVSSAVRGAASSVTSSKVVVV
ncbi:MAG TPA: glycosyltransferase 87 family protein [Actinomycetes bacterium]|nr:glycosyltransferase 87 family protein [Actinomycetes bacterium]